MEGVLICDRNHFKQPLTIALTKTGVQSAAFDASNHYVTSFSETLRH